MSKKSEWRKTIRSAAYPPC